MTLAELIVKADAARTTALYNNLEVKASTAQGRLKTFDLFLDLDESTKQMQVIILCA